MNTLTQIAAVLLGLLGGGLLLLGFGFLPYWQSLNPSEFTQLFNANVPFIANTMKPLGFSSVAFVLATTGLAIWKKLPNRKWFIISFILALIMLATFPLYFAETNATLASGLLSPEEISQELIRWQQVHWVRTIAAILACFCMVKAGSAVAIKTAKGA